ncbi:hybrid sensor histidine kinase/response regulator [Roseisolibacter sp. H3M3-2]|uniref:PAS domain-containing sensor histidine kinase n=1 Tax=Roseisolibacter sp. H3M3-2 TaxID=3031323 RepID=UPI0023DBD5B7|nr:hybrid sensor histidine kinase/response regulator [Roseisolibacter sp. H3M3-2]MDF1505195.1 ATP-binding protein [Roseisolibacter sp. H3M3-2]
MSAREAAERLFAGAGEVRALCREFDWGATSLGPVPGWSPTLRTIVRACLESPAPINLWCGPERLLVYNDGYRRILGAKHPASLGRPGLEVWAEIRADIEPMFAHVDAGGAPIYAEDARFVLSVDGEGTPDTIAYYTFGLSAVRDDDGATVAYFNPATETTARVAAEAALAESRRRLDSALLAGEVGTFEWRIPDDRLFGDANFGRIFGIALDETGAAPLSAYLAALHPDDRDRVVALIEHTLATGAPYEAEYRIIPGAETGRPERWVQARGLLERDAAGRPERFPGVVQDVTRRREAEDERARLLAAAEAARREADVANRAKSDFLASMSHELRTPLNAIGGHTQLLEMELHGPLTPAQRGTLARIDRAQRHLLGLINDILNYAKLESGRVEYVMRAIPLADVVADVLPMVEPLVVARELTVDAAGAAPAPDGGPHVWADREKLAQVLLNLLSNAVKFTDVGGRIAVRCAQQGDAAALTVADTGVGIPADQLEAIFAPFVQVRPRGQPYAEKAEGTGLGLAISRDLARGMGGDLTVASVEGAGSEFTLTLRRAPDDG